MHAAVARALLLACLLAPRAAAAADPIRHEGKPLAEWISQTTGKSEEKALEAFAALKRARFLVNAPPIVVRVLAHLVESGRRRDSAIDALGAYGAVAASVLDASALHALRATESSSNLGSAVALVRIGSEVEQGLRTWRKEAEEALADADRVTRGMNPPKTLEYADTPLHHARTRVFLALVHGGKLGLRGDEVGPIALRALKRPWGHLVAETVLWTASDLGAAAAPLAEELVRYLEDREPVMRSRAVHALAWIPELPPATASRMLKAAVKVSDVRALRPITQGLAVTEHEPGEETVAALKTLSKHADRRVAAWAVAGLARRRVDPERLPTMLLANLRHAEPEVRAAGADGLWSLELSTEEVRKEIAARLVDPDRRVRWRCGASVARAGGGREGDLQAALDALTLGVDGPDDVERVAALGVVRELGAVAAPLRDRVAAWSAVPFPRISGPARRALDAIDGK